MKVVTCAVERTDAKNEVNGNLQLCVIVTCPCGKTAQSWGQSEKIIRRSCWLLSQKCKENNYYITDEPEPKDPDYEAESDDLPF